MPPEHQSYDSVSEDYFAKRGLRRYAGVASLWALGVERPYRSPLGIPGALVTLLIAVVALVGQNRLVPAPEEAFAVEVSRR
jgi:hypothetical protein